MHTDEVCIFAILSNMIKRKYECECPVCHKKYVKPGHTDSLGNCVIDGFCDEHTDTRLERSYSNMKTSTSLATSEDSRYLEEQFMHSNTSIVKRMEEHSVHESNERL